jgi:Fe-S-cluster-containing dehydrogenase component
LTTSRWKRGSRPMTDREGSEARYLFVEPELCTGCRVCEMVCSLGHEGACSPRLSRIRVVKVEELNLNYPAACVACADPVCVRVCPTKACHPAAEGVGVRIDEALCIGCRECMVACPFGAIGFHAGKDTVFVCDLCGGAPACVAHCAPGALQFATSSALLQRRRRARVLARYGAEMDTGGR